MTKVVGFHSLFEIDYELDDLIEQIEEQVEVEGEPSEELLSRFRDFAQRTERRSTGSVVLCE